MHDALSWAIRSRAEPLATNLAYLEATQSKHRPVQAKFAILLFGGEQVGAYEARQLA